MNVWRNKLFEIKTIYFGSELPAKKFGIFSKTFSKELWKLKPTFPEERFGEAWNFFQKKQSLFYLFRTFSKYVSAHWRTFLGRVVRSKVWVSRGLFFRKKIGSEKFFHQIWAVCNILPVVFSKLLSNCPEELLSRFAEKNRVVIISPLWGEICFL